MEQQTVAAGSSSGGRPAGERHIHKFFHGFLNDEGDAGYTLDGRF